MELTEVIQKRRAYRSLEPVEITNELIKDLAKNARLSPSCFNKQPWRFIFVKSRERLMSLFSALNEGNKFKSSELWRKLFGEEFPLAPEEVGKKSEDSIVGFPNNPIKPKTTGFA